MKNSNEKLGKIFICLLNMIVFPIGLASCDNNNITSSSYIDSSTDTSKKVVKIHHLHHLHLQVLEN